MVALRAMLDHPREALALLQDKTRSDLDSDRLLNLALVRLLEIVGETAPVWDPTSGSVTPRFRGHRSWRAGKVLSFHLVTAEQLKPDLR